MTTSSKQSVEFPTPRWLLLIHQVPQKPDYLRVKIGRRLHRIGAVAIRNSVYALPNLEQPAEALQWLAREIRSEGGEAFVVEAHLAEGLSNEQMIALFQAARGADYQQLTTEAQALEARRDSGDIPGPPTSAINRIRRRLRDIQSVDYFSPPSRSATERAIEALEHPPVASTAGQGERPESFQSRVWVTRRGVEEDRIASAWLIRRFIDPHASFKFVPSQGYELGEDEIGFDMFEASFTHEGDRCTFEVLLARFDLGAPGLRVIGEIVHDIDLRDDKFDRVEREGVAAAIAGLVATVSNDLERIRRGSELLDALLGWFATRG